MPAGRLDRLAAQLAERHGNLPLVAVSGRVVDVAPALWRVEGLSRHVALGDVVAAGSGRGEVIRVEADLVSVKPFDGSGPRVGEPATRAGRLTLRPHPAWKGRVLDGFGRPLDGRGALPEGEQALDVAGRPPAAMDRQRAGAAVATGVAVVDLFTPLCRGQRLGIFAGSGVGKSTLLAMLARAAGFSTVVVGLIGERGREVREFVEDVLGEGLARAVVVVSTGDESALRRRLAARTAMAVAESFRDRGEDVLLIVDSMTRYAHACREIALGAGELPVSRGYPPSVFDALPQLLERAGPGPAGAGSITGVFSVLVDGDDHDEPVADVLRGVLDGHVVLSRRIAAEGRYPAVDPLASLSRLAQRAWTAEQAEAVRRLRAMIERYEDTGDLRLMGGYREGADAALDQAVRLVPQLYDGLRQGPDEPPCPDPFALVARLLQP